MQSAQENKLALEIYALSQKFIEKLDELEGTSLMKRKMKMHAKALIKEIETFDKSVFQTQEADDILEYVKNYKPLN